MKPQIHLIFPTPIFQSDLDRPLTKEELNFINKIKQKTYINVGNKTSLNNKILNHKPFKKIKNQIDMALKQYLDFILKPKNDLLFIFPSPLYHSVSTKKGDNERISLAFNTFFKGKIGTEKDLTELII